MGKENTTQVFLKNIFFGSLQNIVLLCSYKTEYLMDKVLTNNIPAQVKEALDGRTQRWLALKIQVPETDMSKKMNGTLDFTEAEINAINQLLKVNIKLEKY